MRAFQYSATIARTPPEVFAVVSDPREAVHFVSGVTASRKVTEGPIGVGTTFRETRVVDGSESAADLRITSYEQDAQVSVTASADGITVTYRYDLGPDGAGTRLDWTCELDAEEWQQGALSMVAEYLRRTDGDHLQHLKAYLETTQQGEA